MREEKMSDPIPEKNVRDRVRFVQHRGKSILLEDFSDLDPGTEFFDTLKKAQETIKSRPQKSVLVVAIVSNIHYDLEALNAMGAFVKANTPFIKCSAVVGIKGMAKVGMMAVNRLGGRSIKTFDTTDEALDYLVSVE
jgi:hypothetical protein